MGKQDVEKLKFYSILVIAFLVVSLFLTLDGVENLTGAAISIQTQDYSENLQNLYPNYH